MYLVELHNEYECVDVLHYGKKTDVIRSVARLFEDVVKGKLNSIEVVKNGNTSLYLTDFSFNSYIALRPRRHGLVLRPVNENLFVYDRETGEYITHFKRGAQKAFKWIWEDWDV